MSIEKMWQKFSSMQGTSEMANSTDNFSIGDNSGDLLLDSAEQIQQHLVSLAGQAMRQIVVFSPTLTHQIYNSIALAEAISAAIRAFHKLQVKVIICNPQPCISQHHHLVELARQLSSFVEIRRAHDDYLTVSHDYFIADGRAYVYREYFERLTATANYSNPLKAQTDSDQFMGIWEQSQRDTEFLQLYL